MPELPEVETVRRTLEERILGRRIDAFEAIDQRFIRYPSVEEFTTRVVGTTITSLERRGKYLVICLDSGDRMIVHLRMTGRLVAVDPGEPRAKHTHLIFRLGGPSPLDLRYIDQRTFGGVVLVGSAADDPGLPAGLRALGPEPLSPDFTVGYLRRILQGRSGKIKSLLLDQRLIAGLGNIYADEALFRAGIHPERSGGSLKPGEVRRLHGAIRAVLEHALSLRGTTFYSFVDGEGRQGDFAAYLNVYGRAGEPCPACGGPVRRFKLGARSTHFCPGCQKEPGKSRRNTGERGE